MSRTGISTSIMQVVNHLKGSFKGLKVKEPRIRDITKNQRQIWGILNIDQDGCRQPASNKGSTI